MINERKLPCADGTCSWCCNPVKVDESFPEENIPKDEAGKKLWTPRKEVLIPESESDTTRLKTYDCKNFDKASGHCSNYANRPEICKSTKCIDWDSVFDADEQHQKIVGQKFFVDKK